MKIFLSHSSLDKPEVMRLADDLKRGGVDVWLDNSEIKTGQSLLKRVEEGLKDCDYFALWITKNSMESNWVKEEWNSAFTLSVNGSPIEILPLRAEECDIPIFLQSRLSASFVEDYELGLEALFDTLGIAESKPKVQNQVSRLVKTYIRDLEKEKICIPFVDNDIEIIQHLKKIPRSGKIVRLENFRYSVPIRSIYDHVSSLSHSADILIPYVNHGIKGADLSDLAVCIAYHELNEVLLGDVPKLTNLDHHKMETARVRSFRRLKDQEDIIEPVTNKFIRLYLDKRNQIYMDDYMEIINDQLSPVTRFFHVLDKIDPIIAIWRYLHHFRSKLGETADEFLEKLADFFKNKKVRTLVAEYHEDVRLSELVHHLLDMDFAARYYLDKREIEYLPTTVGLPRGVVTSLIQGRYFSFAESTKAAWDQT